MKYQKIMKCLDRGLKAQLVCGLFFSILISNFFHYFLGLHPGQDRGQGLDQVHLQDQRVDLRLEAEGHDQDQAVLVLLIRNKKICFENLTKYFFFLFQFRTI